MSSKFWASLSDDYEKLFETGLGYDVIIYAGEEPDVEEIHAHSNILCIRSRYFHASFSNEWARKKDGKFILKKPNIEPRLLRIILRFLYCGHIELKDLQGLDVLKLLVAVDELNIQPLISHFQECLIEHQTEFLHQNPTGVLEMVYNHETFTDLWNFYLETICSEPKILFDSDQFPSLKAPLLESLLGRDDLNMDEIEIWDHLLRWCMIQHHVKGNLTGWSKEEVAKVERSLCRFVPLIRFYGIQPSDFFYKVYCYQEILPKELIHELLEFHIVPDVKPKVDTPPPRRFLANSTSIRSSLVDSKYVPLFVSWIDRKEPDGRDHPYEFELLYQSGPNEFAFNATEFHKKCDNKGPTIWIAKVQDSNRLIGGYNPLDWNGHRSKKSGDSFLFGFADGRKPDTAKVGYVDLASDALCCFKNQGPSMGDLYCSNGNHWIYGSEKIYPDVGIPAKFAIEACEVFRVIKRRDVV